MSAGFTRMIFFAIVIPAQSGGLSMQRMERMDSRLRGNDE